MLEKCQETYISHLARLGVISHVADLAGPLQEVEAVQEEPEVKGNDEETEKKVLFTCTYVLELLSQKSLLSLNKGNHYRDGVWISDLIYM